jgi:hypothetical protein
MTDELIRSMLRHEDGKLYWVSGRKAGQEAGCKRKDGRTLVRVGGRGGPLLLRYRVIWFLVHGSWPELTIDHINRDPSDDRPENLRVATSAQQLWNTGKKKQNKSGFKGVIPYGRKYTAQINSKHIGVFETAFEANQAYTAAAIALVGAFANGG